MSLETTCLGPLQNLEVHLPCEWWKNCFNLLYLKTDGDIVENTENTRNEVELIVTLAKPALSHRILDLCCGQGRHSIELASRGFRNITGFDYSQILLEVARANAERAGYDIDFHQGDMRELKYADRSFDLITMMGNSFGYFDSASDDFLLLVKLLKLLEPGGILILDLCNGEWQKANFKPRSWEWVEKDCLVCRERVLSEDEMRLVSREIIIHTEKGVIKDQFYAERLYTKACIISMLERAGFHSIQVYEGLQVLSTRNQDLGFMENRMIIMAKRPEVSANAD